MTTVLRHWTKVHRGFYRLAGTRYAVASMNADAVDGIDFVSRQEWAVVLLPESGPQGCQDGENLDWFDSMKDAKADAERQARRSA